MLMAWCKTAVSPVLMHWIYCSLALSHQCGLVQDCSISSANALDILQSCTKPSMCNFEVITAPADSLTLLGAGTSAGTGMTKVCTGLALEGLTSMRIKHLSPLTRDQYVDQSVIDRINSLMPGDLIVRFGQWLV